MNRFLALLVLSLSAACAVHRPPGPPPPPTIAVLTVDVTPRSAMVRVFNNTDGEVRIKPTRLDGTIVEEFPARSVVDIRVMAEGYLSQERLGVTLIDRLRITLTLDKPPPPPVPDLSIVGREFRADGVLYVPRWVSGLSLLARPLPQQIAFLDWAAATGFNGVRVFAGALTWAGQTPEGARGALPALLDMAAARGLNVEVTGITDSATGYDAREHVRLLAGLLTNRRGVVFELANEVGHPTQAANITADQLRVWGRDLVAPTGILWAVGAASVDEPDPSGVYPTSGGDYSTAHLDRGRDPWNQLRRVREIFAISEVTGQPSIDNEPIGCAEPGTPGQRLYDPALFYLLGALDRAFAVGGVHHSQAGLLGELPGQVQQACATAYVQAHRDVESALTVRGQYKNVGHAGGPFASARFVDGGSAEGLIRAYSFILGDKGATVLVGLKGDPQLEWANGWRLIRVVGMRTAQDGRQVVVWEIGR